MTSLSYLLDRLEPQIPWLGGRRFVGNQTHVCLNDLVRRFMEIKETDPQKLREILDKIDRLDRKGSEALRRVNWVTRVLTRIRQILGNWTFKREPFLQQMAISTAKQLAKTMLEKEIELGWFLGRKIVSYSGNEASFRLSDYPNLIFHSSPEALKGLLPLSGNEASEHVFNLMVNIKEACLALRTRQVDVPSSRLVTRIRNGKETTLIVQRYDEPGTLQDLPYHELVAVIQKTGWSDVVGHLTFSGSKMWVINPGEERGFEEGICGWKGLIAWCQSVKQIDGVIAEASRYQKLPFEQAKQQRMRALEHIRGCLQFYERKGLTDPFKPIVVDVEQLGLNLNLEGKITMRELVSHVIQQINWAIDASKTKKKSMQETRYVSVSVFGAGGLSPYNELEPWIVEIFKALQRKEEIFSFEKSGPFYRIQA